MPPEDGELQESRLESSPKSITQEDDSDLKPSASFDARKHERKQLACSQGQMRGKDQRQDQDDKTGNDSLYFSSESSEETLRGRRPVATLERVQRHEDVDQSQDSPPRGKSTSVKLDNNLRKAATGDTGKDDDEEENYTKLGSDDGHAEENVGRLPEPNSISQPTNGDSDPYIFISHTGKDEVSVKENLARPTHWFLNNICLRKAFLDDSGDTWGQDKQTIAKHAYECTHALVLLSPFFRKRKFCVQELNTFMYRLQRQRSTMQDNSKFRILLALWQLNNVDGYHPTVQDIIWISHRTQSAAYYLMQELWPNLVKALDLSTKSKRELREHFVSYVDSHMGGRRPVPQDFVRYVKDLGAPLLTPTSSDEESGNVLVGISFSAVYMDRNTAWNEQVLERKDHIEQNLKKIARHGTVTYGRGTVETVQRLGAAVVRLECEIEIGANLRTDHYKQVRKALAAIARHLREAGTSEDDLEEMMIGIAWKGSLYLLLEAPDSVLEKLSSCLSRSGCNLILDENLYSKT